MFCLHSKKVFCKETKLENYKGDKEAIQRAIQNKAIQYEEMRRRETR